MQLDGCDFWFGVGLQGLGVRVDGTVCRVWGLGLGLSKSRSGVCGSSGLGLEFMFWKSGFEVAGMPICLSASEQRGNNSERFKEFDHKAKASIWP